MAKYVIIKFGSDEEPIVFSETIHHSAVARQFVGVDDSRIVSAGFVHIDSDGKYRCHGESWSLKVKSREGDTALLNRKLNPVF